VTPGSTIEIIGPDKSPTINSLILEYYRFAQTYYVKDGQTTDEVYGIRAALSRLKQLYGKTVAKDFGLKAF
jgi:hypothetical protein